MRNPNDPLVPILILLCLSIIVVHVSMIARRISYVKWETIRRKRHVSRKERRLLWFTLWSLIALGLALVFAMFRLNLI